MPRRVDIKAKAGRLRMFFRKENRLPGYEEMLDVFGYKSKNAVHGLLSRLAELGYIRKTGRKIAPTDKLTGTIRLLGTVQAGFPSPAEEELVDVMSLDEYLVNRPDATFMLTVSGDSMIEAGIHPGDIVLVEKGCTPANGDIVIAQVDGEWTMKYYMKDRDSVRLEPANRKYETIVPKLSLIIGGVVKSLVRKYH
ncbi:MAG: transcriptional repressor LexA [bacterium]